MAQIVLLIGISIFLYYGLVSITKNNPLWRRKAILSLLAIVTIGLIVFLIFSGKLAWIAGLIGVWLPWIIRAWQFRKFLKRAHHYQQASEQEKTSSSQMTEAEAFKILGLKPEAKKESIQKAHRNLISRLHSDVAGSDYLASLINQARDVLLKNKFN